MKFNSIAEGVGFFVVGLCIVFIASLILALPVMWLWNSTLPELFGTKEIGWWMAWKVSFLSTLLFRNFTTGSNKS